ncbi:MAG: bifunctional riboflavin kinase/FAD synthetase [Pseudomonadota bacterium]
MLRFDGLVPDPATGRPCLAGATVALGNFDGVHRGHQALIAGARAARPAASGAALGVVTFEPHPRQVFSPDSAPFRLTTDAERARQLALLGVERLAVLAFDGRLHRLSPASFARDVLSSGLGIAHVTVGADFRFGRGRLGTPGMLSRLGRALGFGVTVLPLVGDETSAEIAAEANDQRSQTVNGEGDAATGLFSSTAARQAVQAGRMADAAAILGRPHAVTGPVIRGDQRGRTLGYPTANLDFGMQVIPAFGVYAARVVVLEGAHAGTYDGVASIGERPTFGINAPNFEVHLFDFSGDLYTTPIAVELVAFLRGEAAYRDAETLIAQMDRDSAEARDILAGAHA